MHPGMVRSHTFLRFLHGMAGTGMYDQLGHGFTLGALRLRWRDWRLHRWLFREPANSYAWRMLETNPERIPGCGRRMWPGARGAVEDAVGLFPVCTVVALTV